jgi:hypothetical protein
MLKFACGISIAISSAFILFPTVAFAQLAGEGKCGRYENEPLSVSHLNGNKAGFTGALICLLNAERVKDAAAKRIEPVLLHSTPKLREVADKYANEAARLRWWSDTNSHVHPTDDRDLASLPDAANQAIDRRIRQSGYCNETPRKTAEITYSGQGKSCPLGQCGSPAAAVNWWMNISTAGHRETVLRTDLTEMGLGMAEGVALGDVTLNAGSDAGTFVVDFGDCNFMTQEVITDGEGPIPPNTVAVTADSLHIRDCDEIGACEWRVYCALGDNLDDATSVLWYAKRDTGEAAVLDALPFEWGTGLPVTMTCQVREYDGPFLAFEDSVWEVLGTKTMDFDRDTGSGTAMIAFDGDEGGVDLHFRVKAH